MDETPSDSGARATERLPGGAVESAEAVRPGEGAAGGFRLPPTLEWRAQLRRPAVWGLALLIVVALAIQIWLLFL